MRTRDARIQKINKRYHKKKHVLPSLWKILENKMLTTGEHYIVSVKIHSSAVLEPTKSFFLHPRTAEARSLLDFGLLPGQSRGRGGRTRGYYRHNEKKTPLVLGSRARISRHAAAPCRVAVPGGLRRPASTEPSDRPAEATSV